LCRMILTSPADACASAGDNHPHVGL